MQQPDEPVDPAQLLQHPPNLVPREHHGQPLRAVRSHDLQFVQRALEDRPVKEQQGTQCLILGRSRHVPDHRQVGQERVHLVLPHRARVPDPVEPDEPLDPFGVSALGANAHVSHPARLTDSLEQLRLLGRLRGHGRSPMECDNMFRGQSATSGRHRQKVPHGFSPIDSSARSGPCSRRSIGSGLIL